MAFSLSAWWPGGRTSAMPVAAVPSITAWSGVGRGGEQTQNDCPSTPVAHGGPRLPTLLTVDAVAVHTCGVYVRL